MKKSSALFQEKKYDPISVDCSIYWFIGFDSFNFKRIDHGDHYR